MNLVLCGMPGSGKTTVGKLLAERLGMRFVDTDGLITERYGGIPTLFSRYGEKFFRAREREAVERLRDGDRLVISTGGGLVLDEENVEILRRNGRIVYLSAEAETLLKRLEGEPRPLLIGDLKEEIARLLRERTPVYERIAEIVVRTDGKRAEEVAREIAEKTEGRS